MARQTKKIALIRGRRLRVTRLDGCGRPVYSDSSTGVSKGFISVDVTAATTATDEVLVVNASGETLFREASVNSLAGFGVEMVFAEIDPEVFSLITGQPVVFDADGNVNGFDIDTKLKLTNSGFALEVWAGAPIGDACVDLQSQGSFGYLLTPFLQGGTLGDFSVANGAISFTITGASTKDGNSWLRGPYNVQLNNAAIPSNPKVPGPMVSPIGSTIALRMLVVDVAPPTDFVGTRPLLNPTVTPITTVTGTTTLASLNVAFANTPARPAGTGTWYEFGDGTWDYVTTANGATTHLYPVAGTYTVSASTNGVWRTTIVTVPGV